MVASKVYLEVLGDIIKNDKVKENSLWFCLNSFPCGLKDCEHYSQCESIFESERGDHHYTPVDTHKYYIDAIGFSWDDSEGDEGGICLD